MLAGCGDNYYSDDVKESRWLSSTEKAVYSTWHKNSKYGYANDFMRIANDRMSKKNAVPPAPEEFFSDAVIPMRLIEVNMAANQEANLLSDVYRKVTGKDPVYLLNIDKRPSEPVDPIFDQALEETMVVEAEPLADLDTLRKLIDVAKNSNRAKVKMIVNTDTIKTITQKDAEALIREYELFQLESELDK